jgi:hypothetical protein
MFIQVLLVVAIIGLGWYTLRSEPGSVHLAMRRSVLVVVVLVAVLIVVFPNVLNGVANAVGIGRGADLIVYGLVVVFVLNSISSRRRFRESDRTATRLAREIAILNAEPGKN